MICFSGTFSILWKGARTKETSSKKKENEDHPQESDPSRIDKAV